VRVSGGLGAATFATYRALPPFLLPRVDSQLEQTVGPVAIALFGQGPDEHHGGPGPIPGCTYAEWRNASGTYLAATFFGLEGQKPPHLSLPAGLPGSTSEPNGSHYFTTSATG